MASIAILTLLAALAAYLWRMRKQSPGRSGVSPAQSSDSAVTDHSEGIAPPSDTPRLLYGNDDLEAAHERILRQVLGYDPVTNTPYPIQNDPSKPIFRLSWECRIS